MIKGQLQEHEYNSYYQTYLSKVGNIELISGLQDNGEKIISFLESLSEEQFDYAYAEGKWTIKEVVQHIIDTERVFTYRALAFARKDNTALPGYDQDEYASTCEANTRSKDSLLKEYRALRLSTVALFESFSEDMLTQMGVASNSGISVRAIGFILIGHENHHYQILKERYL